MTHFEENTAFFTPSTLFCYRAKERSIALADQLLDPEGKFTSPERAIAELEQRGYSHPPYSYSDSDITLHHLRVLKHLQKEPRLSQKLQSFGLPLHDPQLEEMIGILLGAIGEVSERHVIWAAFSALLCPLRQSVGSCFATAPAILVHEEQPLQFLTDLQDLLSQGKLTRVLSGAEYSVPISPTPGLGELKRPCHLGHPAFQKVVSRFELKPQGPTPQTYLQVIESLLLERYGLKPYDLKATPRHPKWEKVQEMQHAFRRAKWQFAAFSDHLLLKTWEFTVASFVDVKTEFSKWNFYSSLGLHPDEKGGIGELIYMQLEQKLQEANEKLEHFQRDYEITFDQVRATEALMRNVTSDQEMRRLKAEHQVRLYHMRECEEMRDKYAFLAQNTSQFFSFLIEHFVEKFQEHFQEVYDAEMQEVQPTDYDDAPAGFRLLFKHGRRHVGSWTFIHTPEEYIQALKDFFLSIEHSLIEACEWEGGKEEIPPLITAIIHHLMGEEFLFSAFYRMAKAHQVPLKKIPLEQFEKKPWAYTSGGTLPTLLKTYFRREGSLSQEARWVESPQDLCIFLLDTMKLLPPSITEPFVNDSSKRMLATAPTHVYCLLPGQELFRKGWEDPGFTYTWVRDQILNPRQEFYAKIRLTTEEQHFFVQELADRLPLLKGHELHMSFAASNKPLTIKGLRKRLPASAEIDGFFYEMLPLIPTDKVKALFQELGISHPPLVRPLGKKVLHDLLVAALSIDQSKDLHEEVISLMEKRGLAPPRAIVFADTNWSKYSFSFLVNPATNALELWRTDKWGITGLPMHEWEEYLNGSTRDPWAVFLRPYEYST